MIEAYRAHTKERWELGIPPLPLDAEQVAELVELLKAPPAGRSTTSLDLITNNVPPGVDEAAYVKAAFLADVARGDASSPLIDRRRAVELLGTMMGGYNVQPMLELLADEELAETVADQLSGTLLMFDAFHDVEEKAKAGNAQAQRVLESWANAEWFDRTRAKFPKKITLTVFKVPGETNTDDLSPGRGRLVAGRTFLCTRWPCSRTLGTAWSRIPSRPFMELKNKGNPVAYVGDVVGTGSSRKSAANSVHMAHGG